MEQAEEIIQKTIYSTSAQKYQTSFYYIYDKHFLTLITIFRQFHKIQ